MERAGFYPDTTTASRIEIKMPDVSMQADIRRNKIIVLKY